MVSVDPLGGLNLPLGKLDSSRFWHGSDVSPTGKWSIGSRPSLFLLLEGRSRPVGLALLQLRCRVRLEVRCEAGHSAKLLRLRRPERMGFFQSIGSGLSSIPKVLMGARRPKPLLHVSGYASTEVSIL